MSPAVVAIIAAVVAVAAYFFLRSTAAKEEGSADAKPLTLRAQLGFGIIALGALILFMPSTSANIAAFDFVESEPYAILIGSTYVFGFLVVVAGLAVWLVKGE
jgi:hypothetical protein